MRSFCGGRYGRRVKASSVCRRVCVLAFTVGVFFLTGVVFAAEEGTEIEKRTILRVCADPNNLPYSNRLGQGFENKIAELFAAELGISLSYFWFPQSLGFVRSTLGVRRCDLVVGISAAHESVLNTNPYYSSAFALVYPADSGLELSSLSDKALKEKELRIGLVARTPPTGLLLENGLMTQVSSYHLVVDTRVDSPSEQIVKDMLAGKLDVAVLWGPFAGYLNKRHDSRLKVVPLSADESDEHRMIYQVTMGVRHGEIKWKRELNRLIRENQEKIHALLREYNIPLVVKE